MIINLPDDFFIRHRFLYMFHITYFKYGTWFLDIWTRGGLLVIKSGLLTTTSIENGLGRITVSRPKCWVANIVGQDSFGYVLAGISNESATRNCSPKAKLIIRFRVLKKDIFVKITLNSPKTKSSAQPPYSYLCYIQMFFALTCIVFKNYVYHYL